MHSIMIFYCISITPSARSWTYLEYILISLPCTRYHTRCSANLVLLSPLANLVEGVGLLSCETLADKMDDRFRLD